MSRLIEALRKAEEEKRKEETDKETANSPSLSVDNSSEQGLAVSKPNQELTSPEQENQFTHSIDFELEPTEPPVSNKPDNSIQADSKTSYEPDSSSQEDSFETKKDRAIVSNSEEAISAKEHLDEFESISSNKESDERDYSRRQTDTIQIDVIPDKERSPTGKRKLFWVFLVGFILLIFGIVYFFFLYDGNKNQYATNTSYSQNRGFLDTTRNMEANVKNEEADKLQTLLPSEDTENENTLLDTAQNIVDSTFNVISENTFETITAVNTLLENDAQTEEPLIEQSEKPAVFQIKRSTLVKGSSTSLSYAQDNVQGGEHNAARMEYEELLRNQPTNRNALIGLASLEAETGNKNVATQLYSQLLQLNPQDPVAQVGLLENTEHSGAASYEVELKTLASIHRNSAFIPFKLGNLFATQNRWSEAKNAFDTALQTAHEQHNKPVNPDYAFNLAIALEKTQQPHLALGKYQEAKELSYSSSFSFNKDVLNDRINALESEL